MLDTQLNAYTEVQSESAAKRFLIMELMRGFDLGLTTCEIAERLNLPFESVQPRISELKELDLIRDSGARREGRSKPSAVWVINPEPKPKKRKMKPIGDKELFGKMMQAAYACKAQPNAYHIHRMQQLAIAWITDFSNNLEMK